MASKNMVSKGDMMPHPSATTFSKYVLFEEATSSTLVNMLLSSFGLLDKSNEIKFLPAIGILQKKIYLIVQKKICVALPT
jgi:hypothetical protein